MPTSVVFTGTYPKLVTFKIAVLNKDNTLTSMEEYNNYNFMTGTFQSVLIPNDVNPGINYYFIAVDNDDTSNYATLGPLVIRKTNAGTNPSASITADSNGIAYKTDGGAIASASITSSTSSTSSTPKITLPKTIDNEDKTDQSHPNIAAIAGGAAGGMFVIMIVIWIILYKCCIKKHRLGNITVTYNNNGSNAQSQFQGHKQSNLNITRPSPKKNNVKPLEPQKPKKSLHRPNINGLDSSPSTDNTIIPPYPYSHQQGYPSYPYPQDPNLAQDCMPIPEHFGNASNPYPPELATIQDKNFTLPQYHVNNAQQDWNPQQFGSFLAGGGYPTTIENQGAKTLRPSFADTLLAENAALKDVKPSDKEEYQEKPNTASDVQITFKKPDDAHANNNYNKPHER
ncbi:hypothetical protein INT47_001815 [Mucor saturninus]|uniref:Uncharacterized protein n=1 Tax=Mucor saturninus TaxID=64648 RepID=A0A8H7QW58_9FUNG|nr:hypothetical protein INT47_001815 [Mucor saturninus]